MMMCSISSPSCHTRTLCTSWTACKPDQSTMASALKRPGLRLLVNKSNRGSRTTQQPRSALTYWRLSATRLPSSRRRRRASPPSSNGLERSSRVSFRLTSLMVRQATLASMQCARRRCSSSPHSRTRRWKRARQRSFSRSRCRTQRLRLSARGKPTGALRTSAGATTMCL